jgi:mono/diheme cytochrome c family protein
MKRLVVASGLGLSVLFPPACAGQTEDVEIPVQDPELVATGAKLYDANCAECHGTDLRGTDKGPSHLSEIYKPDHHADGAFFFAVQAGSRSHHWSFEDMPPVEGLTPEDVEAIVAFVREQQRLNGFEPYPP